MNSDTSLLKTLSKTEMVRNYERAFGDATSLPVAVVAKDDWRLALHGKRHENPFCALIVSRSKNCAACLQCQASLRQRADGKAFIKTCPYGLAEAAVPVRVGTETVGFLVTGQVMREKPTEAQFETVAKKLDSSIDQKEARQMYFSTPVVPKRMFESSVQLHLRSIASGGHMALLPFKELGKKEKRRESSGKEFRLTEKRLPHEHTDHPNFIRATALALRSAPEHAVPDGGDDQPARRTGRRCDLYGRLYSHAGRQLGNGSGPP